MKRVRVPSYRHHKPTGQAVVTLSGKDHYLGQYSSQESRQRYARLLAEWEASNRSPTFGQAVETLTMAQVVLAFLDHAKPYYGEDSTEYDHLRRCTKPISELYPNFPARSFGPAEFKACRQWWQSDPSRTRQYVNKLASKLRRIIKWAVSEGKMNAESYHACQCVDPIKVGRTNSPEAPKVGCVDDKRVDAVIKHLSPIVADMVRLQRLTGARPGEVCGLKPSMVDRSSDVWKIELTEHKTAHHGKSRTVYAGPKAQAVLAKYLMRSPQAYCFSPAESVEWQRRQKTEKRVTPPSCGNKPGSNRKKKPKRVPSDHYDSKSYAKAVKYACEQAYPTPEDLTGRERLLWRKSNWFAPNQLRHNRATEIRSQLGLEAASAALGHSSQQITLTYAEKNEQLARQSAKLSG
jgi:integrase